MFQELGPDARALLKFVAFFPQCVDENNLDWLFPTIPNGIYILNKFCILSLTYWSNSFITMFTPLRDHPFPKDPKSSRLLCMTKGHYFTQMPVDIDPNRSGYGESRWITSEDMNVEHLLDVFTTVGANSDCIWDACLRNLVWHKTRLTILGQKIERPPDAHPPKPNHLFELSRWFQSVGNHVERKRLPSHTLELCREQRNDHAVVQRWDDYLM